MKGCAQRIFRVALRRCQPVSAISSAAARTPLSGDENEIPPRSKRKVERSKRNCTYALLRDSCGTSGCANFPPPTAAVLADCGFACTPGPSAWLVEDNLEDRLRAIAGDLSADERRAVETPEMLDC